jgi:hypothetical protein
MDNALQEEFRKEPVAPFEKALYDESRKVDWQLRHLTKQTQGHGHKDFDAQELFKKTGVAHGRVIKSNPIIIPAYGDFQFGNFYPVPWSPVGGGGKVQGYDYALGFAGQYTKDTDEKQKIIWTPAIYIDHEILSELSRHIPDLAKKLKEKEDISPPISSQESVASSVLSNMRAIFALSFHDYIHHSIYNDISTLGTGINEEWDMDKPSPGSAGYSFVQGGYAPIYDGAAEAQAYPQKAYSLSPEKSDFAEYVWMHGGFDRDNINGKINTLELHAEAVHRDNIQGIVGEVSSPYTHPGSNQKDYGRTIRLNIIRRGAEFLDSLESFRQEVEKTRDAQTADRMTAYLAELTLGRFFRYIPMDDSALISERFALSSGKTASFKEVADSLKIPPFEFTPHDGFKRLSESTLEAAENSRNMKHTIADNPLAFSAEDIGLDAKDPKQLDAYFTVLMVVHNIHQGQRSNEEILSALKDFIERERTNMKIDFKEEMNKVFTQGGAYADSGRLKKAVRKVFTDLSPEQYHRIKDFIAASLSNGDIPYAQRMIEQWLPENMTEADMGKPLKLSGFSGLQARVLIEGSEVHTWLHDLKPWNDPRYPTAQVNANYDEAFGKNNDLLERPAYKEALGKYEQYEQARRQKSQRGSGASVAG